MEATPAVQYTYFMSVSAQICLVVRMTVTSVSVIIFAFMIRRHISIDMQK